MSSSARVPHPAFAEAMTLMDRVEALEAPTLSNAETLVRNTYQQQGLTVSEDMLRQVLAEREPAPFPVKTPATPVVNPPTPSSTMGFRVLPCMILLSGLLLLGGTTIAGLCQPPSNAELVMAMREQLAAGNQTTARVAEWFTHDSDGMRIRQHGDVVVMDKHGRAVVVWSKVDSAMCEAVVKSVNENPSVLSFAIDGSSEHVSCAGPSHTIQISPPWTQRL